MTADAQAATTDRTIGLLASNWVPCNPNGVRRNRRPVKNAPAAIGESMCFAQPLSGFGAF
jgi:hypothetical protein